MAAAIANTNPTRSNLGWSSNCRVLSLFFFSSVLLMQMPKGNAALAPEEESVLQILRQRFNLRDWRGDVCGISWITCSNGSEVAHVEAIDLNNQYLTGTIPADVAKLRHIKDLNLTRNELQGPIPDLSNMTNLTNLDLSYNKLSGRILDTSAFTNISTIVLGSNNLSGGIPASLFQHPSVTRIDLSWNRVLGGTLPNMSDLIKLRILDLSWTDIKGIIPESINKLAQAEVINLSWNMLKGPIPDLSNMTNLTNLDLSANELSGRILDTSAFTKISTIRLSYNNLSGGIPASLFQHPSMIFIGLRWNQVLGGPLPDMSDLIKLRSLDLGGTDINGTIPESINKLAQAVVIDMGYNRNLQGTIPNLNEMVALQFLDVQSCGLSGLLPGLQNSTRLSDVTLADNDFSGYIPRALFEHPTLRRLDLSNNPKLYGEIPDMSQMINLEKFDLSNCNFKGPLPSMQANIKLNYLLLANNQLTSLPSANLTLLNLIDISNNKMRGNLPELPAGSAQASFGSDLRLSHVNFENNYFSGEIPVSWTELTFLRTMRLGNNGLNGYIPELLGRLTSLQELNLTSNNFSGSIPKEIGWLKNLISLDLRNNLFDGIVPEELASLPSLTTLRLETNRFTAIPEALIQKSKERQINLTYDNNTMIIRANSTAESDLSTGAIVGIVIANGVLVSILGLVLYCMIHTRNSKLADKLSREDMPKSSRAFTLKQIKAITANNKTLIGKGGFGKVYHGKLPDGKEVAVKVRAVDSKQGTPEFLNEVRLLSRLHHRNLVPLVGYCQEAQQQILVYQYMAQGTLHKHLYHTGSNTSVTNSPRQPSYQPLDWKTRLDIAINAARGLEYLHKDCNPPVIHRDVKTANILLTEKLQAKVADLGISKQTPELDSDEVHNLSGISTAIKGTFGYLDPEYLLRRKLTTKSDIYSFGVVLLEIITGRRPQSDNFPNSAETNLIDWVRDAVSNNEVDSVVDDALRGEYKMDCMLKVARTALSCVSPSGAKRPDMGEIVHILIEALQIEGQYIETSTLSTEITVLFSGPVNPPLFSRSARRHEHSSQSYEALRHPSWNTDPR